MYYQQTDDKPCAYITKNKQRIKQFGQNVYLKDGSEFEIELYNPSRKTVLSKIKITGEFIAGGGALATIKKKYELSPEAETILTSL